MFGFELTSGLEADELLELGLEELELELALELFVLSSSLSTVDSVLP